MEPEGKNGRALPVFFSLPPCTDAESLEPGRGFARVEIAADLPQSQSRIKRAASNQKVLVTGSISLGFIDCFAEPGAIARVLIPLPCFQRGCRELSVRYADLRS